MPFFLAAVSVNLWGNLNKDSTILEKKTVSKRGLWMKVSIVGEKQENA